MWPHSSGSCPSTSLLASTLKRTLGGLPEPSPNDRHRPVWGSAIVRSLVLGLLPALASDDPPRPFIWTGIGADSSTSGEHCVASRSRLERCGLEASRVLDREDLRRTGGHGAAATNTASSTPISTPKRIPTTRLRPPATREQLFAVDASTEDWYDSRPIGLLRVH
jgi:hypothetical protein